MNYYQARQRVADGRWNWTCMMGSNGVIVPNGACIDHEAEGHVTQEEAERCFYEYELANLSEGDMAPTHEPCKVCGVLTSKLLGVRGHPTTPLCDVHRNVEDYRKIHPFVPGRQIVSSW